MKKIYFSFLTICSLFNANAQLTQANHAPASGETYTMLRCDSVATSPGASGAGAIWNYSAIATYSNLSRTYTAQTAPSSTYPLSNIAVASAANDISYLASATNSLGYYGGNIAAAAIVGTITYTSPAVNAIYPMNLNTTSSSAIGGTLFIPALSLSGTFTGNSNVLVDGSGTLSLPGTNATFANTLRVVTSQTINVTASIANATIMQSDYNYYTPGIKAPVFTISSFTAVVVSFAGNTTSTQTFVARNKNAVNTATTDVSIGENLLDNSNFIVFPNPATNHVNFVTNHPDAKYVSVYDITGKLVEKQFLNDGKLKLDVSSYRKGLYLYTVSESQTRTLKSGKITVSQ